MDIPGLTRENVASHLQKYRKGLKRNTIELNQEIFDNAKIRRESENQFEYQQFALNNDLNDNNKFDELATLLAFEQKQPQNSSDSGAQINTDSVDVPSYSLEDHWGSNASNLAILSEFENMDDTDELYVALSSVNNFSYEVDCTRSVFVLGSLQQTDKMRLV
ncbi:uncharacterized protein LOC110110981 isoform X2 [Dendrobium catenatum]|uniref:uncharacterized protein LOC110110981 isoform X2 n=1 Tax=Dendrobium catenatum TaxID=906689 RepID=UPI00109FB9A4|nr:uncharacterized protein LOC110110981 isoform X2 [Dendrobium catenatum]